jgi:hypothetical protein
MSKEYKCVLMAMTPYGYEPPITKFGSTDHYAILSAYKEFCNEYACAPCLKTSKVNVYNAYDNGDELVYTTTLLEYEVDTDFTFDTSFMKRVEQMTDREILDDVKNFLIRALDTYADETNKVPYIYVNGICYGVRMYGESIGRMFGTKVFYDLYTDFGVNFGASDYAKKARLIAAKELQQFLMKDTVRLKFQEGATKLSAMNDEVGTYALEIDDAVTKKSLNEIRQKMKKLFFGEFDV